MASVAEDVYKPEKNIAVAMLLSLGVVTLLYVLVVFVASGVLGNALDGSLTPISDAAKVFMGKGGGILMGIAALLAFISTANAGIMASSRYPFALARDEMMPEVLARQNSRGMPSVALWTTTAIIVFSLFLPLKLLVKMGFRCVDHHFYALLSLRHNNARESFAQLSTPSSDLRSIPGSRLPGLSDALHCW